jgi:RNA polymerase sigma-70 factor (ECF subfamily)
MPERTTEKILLDAAVTGDTAAAEKLLMTHFVALERYLEPRIPPEARRQLGVEDVLQEVLVQAFRDIKQFQHREDASFFAWLKTIADHRLADALKAVGRKKRGGDRNRISARDFAKTSTIGMLIDIVDYNSNLPDDSARRHEAQAAIQIALATLPEDQRDVLRARYIDGHEVDQIAERLGRTQGAVRGLLKRGKEKLAKAMGRSSAWLSSK